MGSPRVLSYGSTRDVIRPVWSDLRRPDRVPDRRRVGARPVANGQVYNGSDFASLPRQGKAGSMKRFARTALMATGLLSSVLLQGCLTVPINIRSNPSGATVAASGEVIGSTPMELYADDVFPAQRVGIGWERRGTLSFNKPGCKPLTLDVDNELMKRSIKVDLECDPAQVKAIEAGASGHQPAGSTAIPAAPAAATAPPAAPVSAVDKLEELERLRSKGLITDAEYQSLRQRVLNRF